MRKNRKSRVFRGIALILVLVQLFAMAGCVRKDVPDETDPPTEPAPQVETQPHEHLFADGVCACGETNGLDGFTVEVAEGLNAVLREDTAAGMVLTSDNAAGEMQNIRLNKAFDAAYSHYYEIVYRFTSTVAGTVRFTADGVCYESGEYEVAAGENEIAVRFAAGEGSDGKVNTSLELGGLDPFSLTVTAVTCEELKADFNNVFLDVAPEKASGAMETTPEGHLAATYKTDEGWRVKLAVDRPLVKGKTYETTFVFTRSGGKDQNVTYTVYDGAATIIGSKTKWVDSDLCVATFYFTANETVTKGTCLELGQLCDGEDVTLTFTYMDFEEVDEEKLVKLMAENPFPGVNVWSDASVKPAVGTQSAEGLKLVNTNAATDWWKVKLEQDLPAEKGSYYRVTFKFTSNTSGRIKFVNDDATYYGSNEYDVKKGENTFTVELKSGGNRYSCLELGGLGKCELLFTDISVEKIDQPTKAQYKPTAGTKAPATRFGSFSVWTDGSVKKLSRTNTSTTMILRSENAAGDWWKVKLEWPLSITEGKTYEATFAFTSNVAGTIKYSVNGAAFLNSQDYNVAVGANTFTVQFTAGAENYSCLELGGLGNFELTFTGISLKEL